MNFLKDISVKCENRERVYFIGDFTLLVALFKLVEAIDYEIAIFFICCPYYHIIFLLLEFAITKGKYVI